MHCVCVMDISYCVCVHIYSKDVEIGTRAS